MHGVNVNETRNAIINKHGLKIREKPVVDQSGKRPVVGSVFGVYMDAKLQGSDNDSTAHPGSILSN